MSGLPRTVDQKGRLTLGRAFANKLVIVNEIADGVIEIVRAKAVPEPELWLHRNPKAIQAVMDGLEQAKSRDLADGPDIKQMAKFADEMGV
jgi:hypothetical protein